MPRNSGGVYSKPAGTTAVTNTVIESSKYNETIDDIATDLNTPRPVTAGGTGAATVADAQANLEVDPKSVFALKSANYTAVAADNNKFFRFSAAATLALTAAATLGADWHILVFANGGNVTVDPNGSETINGAATLVIPNGSFAQIVCDGTSFRAAQGFSPANAKMSGSLNLNTGGSRIAVTDASADFAAQALFHIKNEGTKGCGLRVESRWTGTTASPYQNNDDVLLETFNDIVSNSTNYSWSLSAPNGYNNIPSGVTDSGFRVGVYGWAVSTPVSGYVHNGTLNLQFGVRGTAGFLGPGSGSSAVINQAIGVRGEIVNDSTGSTILDARAGEFIANAATGTVVDNYALIVDAANGTNKNYSFYGNRGWLFNSDRVQSADRFIAAASGGEPDGTSANLFPGCLYTAAGQAFVARNGVDAKLALQTLNGSGSANLEVFLWGSTVTGIISHTSSATTYATSSDYRLPWKAGAEALTDAGAFIDALRPYRFPLAGKCGFVAHEFAEVSPVSVIGEKDAMTEEGEPLYQQMQASTDDVMAHVIAELQALRRRVAALETAGDNNAAE